MYGFADYLHKRGGEFESLRLKLSRMLLPVVWPRGTGLFSNTRLAGIKEKTGCVVKDTS